MNFAELVADGRCPNKNCDLGGDIEEKATHYDGNGHVIISWECNCGTCWDIEYKPIQVKVTDKPKNYIQNEEE